MRHLAAAFLLSSVSLAAAACSSASPETTDHTATTASDILFNPNPGPGTCSSGYYYQCNTMPSGFRLCGCQALSCDWDIERPDADAYAWIESYGVGSSDGSCPDIKAPTGTWKELSIVTTCPTGWGFQGVPCEVSANLPNQCSPSDYNTPYCCTYVWWPQNYTVPSTCTQQLCPSGTADQSPQALCTHAGMKIKAIGQDNCLPDQPKCGLPGGGSCSACGIY